MRIQLSNNFYLDEFTRSQTAARQGITVAIIPDSKYHHRLQRLCSAVLQPLRDHLGRPIQITSGFRPPKLNRLVGGSRNSQHRNCLAADFTVSDMSPYEACTAILDLDLPFDQLIHEFGQWTHVSINAESVTPRGDVLTSSKFRPIVGTPVTRWRKGLHTMEEMAQLELEANY